MWNTNKGVSGITQITDGIESVAYCFQKLFKFIFYLTISSTRLFSSNYKFSHKHDAYYGFYNTEFEILQNVECQMHQFD